MALLKAINRWTGVDAGYARAPFANFTAEEEEEMKKDFIKFGEENDIKHVQFINELRGK